MTLLANSGTAVLVVTLTLCIQCAGIEVLTRLARASIERGSRVEVHCTLPILSSLWEPSFYFSATSYSTVGYGDIVPPRVWRLLGPVESVTGA